MIVNFDYVSDGYFMILLWFMKEVCMGGVYEYLFLYYFNDQVDMWDYLYIDIYLVCEEVGVGWSIVMGSIMWYWFCDEVGVEVMMDYLIYLVGSFDIIIDMWVYVIFVVDLVSFVIYVDGIFVWDSDYGFYGFLGQNLVWLLFGVLNFFFFLSGIFNFMMDLFFGGCIDCDGDCYFYGKFVLFQIYEGFVMVVQV